MAISNFISWTKEFKDLHNAKIESISAMCNQRSRDMMPFSFHLLKHSVDTQSPVGSKSCLSSQIWFPYSLDCHRNRPDLSHLIGERNSTLHQPPTINMFLCKQACDTRCCHFTDGVLGCFCSWMEVDLISLHLHWHLLCHQVLIQPPPGEVTRHTGMLPSQTGSPVWIKSEITESNPPRDVCCPV